MGLNHLILLIQQIFECLLYTVTIVGTGIKVVNRQNSLLSGSFQSSGKTQTKVMSEHQAVSALKKKKEGRQGAGKELVLSKASLLNPEV